MPPTFVNRNRSCHSFQVKLPTFLSENRSCYTRKVITYYSLRLFLIFCFCSSDVLHMIADCRLHTFSFFISGFCQYSAVQSLRQISLSNFLLGCVWRYWHVGTFSFVFRWYCTFCILTSQLKNRRATFCCCNLAIDARFSGREFVHSSVCILFVVSLYCVLSRQLCNCGEKTHGDSQSEHWQISWKTMFSPNWFCSWGW